MSATSMLMGPKTLKSPSEALAAYAPSLIEVPVGMMPTPFTKDHGG